MAQRYKFSIESKKAAEKMRALKKRALKKRALKKEGTEKVPIFKDQNGKCLRFITSPSTNRLSLAMLDRQRRVKLLFLRH